MGDIYVNTDMVSNIDIPQISTFTLYKCEMSKFQSKVYLSALELDNKKKEYIPIADRLPYLLHLMRIMVVSFLMGNTKQTLILKLLMET